MNNQDFQEGDFFIVGGKLYRFGRIVEEDGSSRLSFEPWANGATSKEEYKDCPKFFRFCCVPSHTDYRQVIDNNFNVYERLTHIPQKGGIGNIQKLLHHIFGEQYNLALDYFRILWKFPIHKLPILLLVSKERQTGKTTFLNFLADVFQGNFTYNSNEEFRSQFNSDWVNKLIVGVDEAFLDRREDAEHFKNLSTAKKAKLESKGVNRKQTGMFAKFVFCSNNEDLPLIIDKEEVRYWVRKVAPLDVDIPDFGELLKAEIPAFLDFISTTEISTPCTSRMWFSPKDLETAALRNIKGNGKNRNERILADLVNDIMTELDVDKIKATPKDLADLCKFANYSSKIEYSDIKEVMKNIWKLEAEKNSHTYDKILWNNGFISSKAVGRFYTISREIINYDK